MCWNQFRICESRKECFVGNRHAQNEIFHRVGIFLCLHSIYILRLVSVRPFDLHKCLWHNANTNSWRNALARYVCHQLKRNCSPYFRCNAPFRFGTIWVLVLVCLMASSIQVSLSLSNFIKIDSNKNSMQSQLSSVDCIMQRTNLISYANAVHERQKCFQPIDSMFTCSYIFDWTSYIVDRSSGLRQRWKADEQKRHWMWIGCLRSTMEIKSDKEKLYWFEELNQIVVLIISLLTQYDNEACKTITLFTKFNKYYQYAKWNINLLSEAENVEYVDIASHRI